MIRLALKARRVLRQPRTKSEYVHETGQGKGKKSLRACALKYDPTLSCGNRENNNRFATTR